ncbi:hypothetical protein K2X33_04745 [bacterium]|nr:hypothetical protein [bacterium]
MLTSSLFLASLAFADIPQVAHIIEPLELEGRELDRHSIFPVADSALESITGPYYLAAVAGYIEDDARAHGYWRGPSGESYRQELSLYRQGKWASTFITERGGWKPLLHLAYALRWDDSPNPWEYRFLGGYGTDLPDRIETRHQIGVGSFVFDGLVQGPMPPAEDLSRLLVLSRLRPEVIGERTEFKFLVGEEPSKLLLRELLRASDKYGLHRYSRREITDAQWKEICAFTHQRRLGKITHPVLREPFINDPEGLARAALRRHFLRRSFRPYVRNSVVYGHISGIPRGDAQATVRHTLLRELLYLPHPAASFLESDSVGTEGIRTDIQAVPMEYFEDVVLRSLEKDPQLLGREPIYTGTPDRSGVPCVFELLAQLSGT